LLKAAAMSITPKSRTAAIALFVAAAAILVGIFSKSWFDAGREGGIGLTGMEECRRGECRSASWGDVNAPGDLTAFGYLGFAGGLLAGLGCAVAGAMLLAGRAKKLTELHAVKALSGTLVVGLLGQIAFVNTVMSKGKAPIGWALIVAVVGAVGAAVVVRLLLTPALREATEPPRAPAPAPQPYTIA
jgi:hypothetical protein